MIRRIAVALLMCVALTACKQDDVPNGNGPVGAELFQGLGSVRVIDAHLVPSGDAAAGASDGQLEYVIARVELTNDTRSDFTPEISDFYLLDRNQNRYQGKDSGASAFTGISNSAEILKVGEKREYTVGFRTTDPNITGTIIYEP
ncbi:MAG TPA: hypothetical protein VHT05_07095 [Candidatus Elarobacter sp.]|jgi:hypothetical protein|nr:hypothetical protein [Candidatus Elarobacter sp.]